MASQVVKRVMIAACGLLLALNVGFILGDIIFQTWHDLPRDVAMAGSNLTILVTWKFLL